MVRLWIIAAIFLLPLGLTAQNWSAEGRVGYFFPSSTIIRKMFPKGWVDYSIEGTYRLDEPRWSTWLNVGYGFKHGHSVPFHNKTQISILPLSLGLAGSFEFPVLPLKLRLGAGPSYSWLTTHNQSDVVKRKVDKTAFGFVLKTNLHYLFWRSFYANVYADYCYTLFNHDTQPNDCIQRYKLNASGLRAGLGLGMEF